MPYKGVQGWNKWLKGATVRTAFGDVESPTIDLETQNKEWVPLKEGGKGTIYSATTQDEDGNYRVYPTIVNGKQMNLRDAYKYSIETGNHLGIYSTPELAEQAAIQMHNQEYSRMKNIKDKK